MARERSGGEGVSGAAGRVALATFRDDDYQDVVDMVRDLRRMANEEGLAVAVAFVKTELRSAVALLGLGPETEDGRALSSFYDDGEAMLLCDPTIAGFNFGTAFLVCVQAFKFERGVRAVFERSAPSEGRAYVPNVPAE